jgi:hypothetical protein
MHAYGQNITRHGIVRVRRNLRCPGCAAPVPPNSFDLSVSDDLISSTCACCGARLIEVELEAAEAAE